MRKPNIESHKNAINTTDPIRTVKITDIPLISYRDVLFTDKDRERFIFNLEKLIRTSLEYKELMTFIKDYIDMSRCTYFKGVSNNLESNKYANVSIHIHHEPFTLYDIVETVLNRWLEEEEDLNQFLIIDEVLHLHYLGIIGLIPLSATIHEMVHSGVKFIPLHLVSGNYMEFVKIYQKYIPEYIKEILHQKIESSKTFEDDLVLLKKQFVYLDVDNIDFPDNITAPVNPKTGKTLWK